MRSIKAGRSGKEHAIAGGGAVDQGGVGRPRRGGRPGGCEMNKKHDYRTRWRGVQPEIPGDTIRRGAEMGKTLISHSALERSSLETGEIILIPSVL